ncbi:unnamed protein product [Boreogadus saida]
MQTRASLVVLLLLACLCGVHHGSPLPQEVLPRPQENFELEKLLGRWYEVAVVATCPYYMQAQKDNPAIVKFELYNSTEDNVVQMRGTVPSPGSCKQISVDFHLTNQSGHFYHHFDEFNADVETYVVQTNYNEYVIWVILSTEQPSGIKTTLFKLYSRAMNVRESVLTKYKALVRTQGMSEDVIIFKDNKGECDQINAARPV